jgi:hypothetical protein
MATAHGASFAHLNPSISAMISTPASRSLRPCPPSAATFYSSASPNPIPR